MYDKSSVLIAVVLFVTMAVAIEIGNRVGRRLHNGADEGIKHQVNALQGSLLGILAVLLGFTFSQSLQRFDARSAAVVDEANAIGTTYLRADILPAEIRIRSKSLLRDYTQARIDAASVSLDRYEDRRELKVLAQQLQGRLWTLAVQAANDTDRPATVNLYLQSLNEMIDSNGKRDAALDRHVPELVLFLLYGTFILTGALLGYAAGVGGSRVSKGSYILVSLIVVLVFIIIDLDRPRRGLIEVDQSSLINLGAALHAEASGTGPEH
jgi:hypothetical protein